MAYSVDLRQRVVDCVNDEKETQQATASAYLDELALLLGSKKSTISYNLIKLGISRKKKPALPRAKRSQTHHL